MEMIMIISVISNYTKYIVMFTVVIYTLLSYVALPMNSKESRRFPLIMQELMNVLFLAAGNLTLRITMGDERYLTLGAVEILVMLAFSILFRAVYKGAEMLLFNNMYMLLSIGMVIISRIDYEKAQRQFVIATAGVLFVFLLPLFRKYFEVLRKGKYLYAGIGLLALGAVLVLGTSTLGANLSFTIAGITFQPSEFIKVSFVLFLACALSEPQDKRGILITAFIGLLHVGMLVLSRDLGSGVVFYVVLVLMLFFATNKWRYLIGGVSLGAAGAVICYFLFSHVRVRVEAFLDPFSNIQSSGYQIAQSMFAISYGGLFGAGLGKGAPENIPFVEADFIFAGITEEMGIIAGSCMILLCLNVFLCLIKQAMGYMNRFSQLIILGSATAYLFQTFLTIGGEVKFIPLTGVTLPLVSYGGSSVLSTLIVFAFAQTISIMQYEKMERFRKRYQEEMLQYRRAKEYARKRQYEEELEEKRRRAAEQGYAREQERPAYYRAGDEYENVSRTKSSGETANKTKKRLFGRGRRA